MGWCSLISSNLGNVLLQILHLYVFCFSLPCSELSFLCFFRSFVLIDSSLNIVGYTCIQGAVTLACEYVNVTGFTHFFVRKP